MKDILEFNSNKTHPLEKYRTLFTEEDVGIQMSILDVFHDQPIYEFCDFVNYIVSNGSRKQIELMFEFGQFYWNYFLSMQRKNEIFQKNQ